MLTTNIDHLRHVVADHIAKDAVIQGAYWDEVTTRGCFIGCLAHGNKPELNEQQYGLPVILQRIAENIFEALSAAEAKAFFAALPNAIGCDGKDLTRVGWQFLAAELRALPPQRPDIQAVIDPVIAGIERLAVGQEWERAEAARAAADAADAAEAAADAEWADEAARAAARAARAAAWAAAATEWAADWTAAMARAVAGAADAAADAAGARRQQRDLLLRLIAEAPIVKENL